ncbi:MAG: hypothetical protein QW379_10220 [Thermoplasmata archaeon]
MDTAPPLPFTPRVAPPGWTAGPCRVYFETSDELSGLDRYELWIEGGLCGNCTSPQDLPELVDGVHSVVIRACDRAGNYAEGKARALIDREPPEPFMIEVVPPSWTNGDPQLIFSTVDRTSGVDHYEMSVDGRQFIWHSSPCTLAGLSDGEHNVTVRAFDQAGNWREASATIYFDRTPPIGLFVSISPDGWTAAEPVLTFSALDETSGLDHYEFSVNGGEFEPCTSPLTLTGMPDGVSPIVLRAIDRAGNYAEGRVEARVDRSPPEPFVIKSEPGGWSRFPPTLSFSTRDNLSGVERYEASIDGGQWIRAKSPWTLPVLPDGAHNITLRAYDRVGNFLEASTEVLIDATPPGVSSFKINRGARTTGSRNVTLSITVRDSTSGVAGMCFSSDGLNYTDWEPFCATRAWRLAGGEGEKRVHVRVRDAAGNEAAASASILYIVYTRSDESLQTLATGALVILLVVTLVLWARWRRKRHGPAPPAGAGAANSAGEAGRGRRERGPG